MTFALVLPILSSKSPCVQSKTKKPVIYNDILQLTINQTEKIKVRRLPSGATLSFHSQNKKIATVSTKGVVTGVDYGKTKIIVSYKSKGKTTKIGSCSVDVQTAGFADNVDKITWSPGYAEKNSLKIWWAQNLKKRILGYDSKKTYSFAIKDSQYITMTEDGIITHIDCPKDCAVFKTEVIGYETYNGKKKKFSYNEPLWLYVPTANLTFDYDRKISEEQKNLVSSTWGKDVFKWWSQQWYEGLEKPYDDLYKKSWNIYKYDLREDLIHNKKELKLSLKTGETINWENLVVCGGKNTIAVTDSPESPDGKTVTDTGDTPEVTLESGKLSFSKAGTWYLYFYLYNYIEEENESAPFVTITVTVQ